MPNIEAHYAANVPPEVNSDLPTDTTIALYVDGKLAAIGPQPEVLDAAIKLLGIKQVYDDDFMLGQNTYAAAAKTLAAIKEYKSVTNAEEAEALRDQAAELLRRANELQGLTEESGDSAASGQTVNTEQGEGDVPQE